MRLRRQHGFTLIELLMGVALILISGTGLLMAMESSVVYTEYLRQVQVARYAAQGLLERLASTPFNTLWTDTAFAEARAGGQRFCMGEDANCNGLLEAGEDRNLNGVLDPSPLAGGTLAVEIVSADSRYPASPVLLDVHVAAMWQHRGRSIGEDRNGNGRLDADEDTVVANERVDSPAMVSLRITPNT